MLLGSILIRQMHSEYSFESDDVNVQIILQHFQSFIMKEKFTEIFMGKDEVTKLWFRLKNITFWNYVVFVT